MERNRGAKKNEQETLDEVIDESKLDDGEKEATAGAKKKEQETKNGNDIGQGPTYLKYILEYLIVCLLADQSGNQQILLNGGSIKLPLNV